MRLLSKLLIFRKSPFYKVLRVRQWLKNGSLFLAILFAGRLFEPVYFKQVLIGVAVFCVLSSGTYILNDIVDLDSDKNHPLKKNRPIASGRMSIPTAQFLSIVLITLGLGTALLFDNGFFLVSALYVLTMAAYSLFLKQIPVIDVMTVAFGFFLRVFAGSFIAETPISALLVLTTIFTALFISFAKRRAEVTLLSDHASQSRLVLKEYPVELVDKYLTLTFGAAFITYSFYTYQAGPRNTGKILELLLPQTLTRPNWLMLTVPVVFYALSRYMYLIYEKKEGESPENIILTDKTLLATSALWVAMVIFLLYGLPLI